MVTEATVWGRWEKRKPSSSLACEADEELSVGHFFSEPNRPCKASRRQTSTHLSLAMQTSLAVSVTYYLRRRKLSSLCQISTTRDIKTPEQPRIATPTII